jgi:hypothetical protein
MGRYGDDNCRKAALRRPWRAALPGSCLRPPPAIALQGWRGHSQVALAGPIVGSSAPLGSPSYPNATNLKAVQDRLHEPPVSLCLHAD